MILKEEVKLDGETSFKLTALSIIETHFLSFNNSVGGQWGRGPQCILPDGGDGEGG